MKKSVEANFVVMRVLTILLLLLGCASAQESNLNEYLWKNRVLLVFPGDSPIAKAEQASILAADPEGINERDLVILEPTDKATLKNYGVSPQSFTVILLGKDGGVKLRKERPVKLSELYQLIDSMPMRQREMRD